MRTNRYRVRFIGGKPFLFGFVRKSFSSEKT
jgi:hypothetical protein